MKSVSSFSSIDVLPEEQAEAMERIELFTERWKCSAGLLTDETLNTCFITYFN